MVLGSGLGPLADEIEVDAEFAFSDAGIPESSVPGHSGKFLRGRLAGAEVLVMKGRVHLYEGHSAQVVTAGVRWMAQQGVSGLVLTNAAGTLDELYVIAAAVAVFGFLFTFRDMPAPPHGGGDDETRRG
jgi:purine-nucleoside phosphorylase